MTKKVQIESYSKADSFKQFYKLNVIENNKIVYSTIDIEDLEIDLLGIGMHKYNFNNTESDESNLNTESNENNSSTESEELDNLLNFLKFLQKEFKYMLLNDSEKDNAVKALGCFMGRCDCLLHMVSHQIDTLNEEKTIED